MERHAKPIRTISGIWLLLVCMLTFPWGLVYAAPVLLAYAVTCRRSWCSQVALAAGCLSLLFMLYCLMRFTLWKAAGNYDAQEALDLLFIAVWQYPISVATMIVTWLAALAYKTGG